MTRRLRNLALGLLLLGVPSSAHALALYGSWWDLGDLEEGIGLGAKQKVFKFTAVSIEARAGWLDLSDADTDLVPLEADVLVDVGIFYGGGGMGYYLIGSETEDTIGYFGVAGAGFSLMGLGVFGEAKYTSIDAEAGGRDLDADGFGVNAGVYLGW
jgi:hypothetical protein